MQNIITLPDFIENLDTHNCTTEVELDPIKFQENLADSLNLLDYLPGKIITLDLEGQNTLSLPIIKNKLAVGQEIIKIHQILQEEEAVNYVIQEPLKEVEEIDIDKSNLIKITASSQSWIISPNTSVPEKKSPQTNEIIVQDIKNIKQGKQDISLPIKNTLPTIEKNTCPYLLSQQTIQDINSITFQIEEEAKAESTKELSKLVTNQIKENISIETLGDKMKIALYPEALGKVTLECDLGEKLKIEISAEKLSTLTLLQSHAPDLKENLIEKLQESLEADLRFSMDNGKQDSQERRNFHYYDLMPLSQEKVELYLIHNGIINFIV